MRHPVTQAAIALAMWLLIIIFSPVILLVGEPVNRYVMRRIRRISMTTRVPAVGYSDWPASAVAVRLSPAASLLLTAITNPLWIALTAPGRWVADRSRKPLTASR